MRWILRAALVLLLIPFFLPSPTEPGIRNLPLLIFICSFFAICLICRRVRLCRLAAKVSRDLSDRGFTVEYRRLHLYAGFLCLTRGDERITVALLVRKRRFYRYHFSDASHAELWGAGVVWAMRNRRLGAVGKGARYQMMFDRQRIDWPDREGERHIVFDRPPNRITDAMPGHGELCIGDKVLGEISVHAKEITL